MSLRKVWISRYSPSYELNTRTEFCRQDDRRRTTYNSKPIRWAYGCFCPRERTFYYVCSTCSWPIIYLVTGIVTNPNSEKLRTLLMNVRWQCLTEFSSFTIGWSECEMVDMYSRDGQWVLNPTVTFILWRRYFMSWNVSS